MNKYLKKSLAILGLAMSLTTTGCQSNDQSSADYVRQELERQFENERESFQMEKEKLISELDIEKEKVASLNKELHDIKEKYGVRGEADYLKEDLEMLVIQNGSLVEYRFVESDGIHVSENDNLKRIISIFNSVTENEKKYFMESYTYINDDRCESYHDYSYSGEQFYFIPDYNLFYKNFLTSEVIPFPEEYCDQKIYSYDDLVEIEKILNEKKYINFDENERKYNVDNLMLVNLNGRYVFLVAEDIICSINSSPLTMEEWFLYRYCRSVTDSNFAIRYKSKASMDYEWNKDTYTFLFDDISCTTFEKYQEYGDLIEWNYDNIVFEEYVSKYFDSDIVSYEDIKKVESELNYSLNYSLRK